MLKCHFYNKIVTLGVKTIKLHKNVYNKCYINYKINIFTLPLFFHNVRYNKAGIPSNAIITIKTINTIWLVV